MEEYIEKSTLEHRLECSEEVNHTTLDKSIPSRGNSKCRALKWKSTQQARAASVAEAELTKKIKVRH